MVDVTPSYTEKKDMQGACKANLKTVHSPDLNSEGASMQYQKVVPYTTKTGLKIGCMYQPKTHFPMSRDAEILQAALLKRPIPAVTRFLNFLRYPSD